MDGYVVFRLLSYMHSSVLPGCRGTIFCMCYMCACACVWTWTTWGPGQGVDHSFIARGGVKGCQRVCVPDLDGSVKTSCGQQVGIIWLKLTVKDSLYMTLETIYENEQRNHKSGTWTSYVLLSVCSDSHVYIIPSLLGSPTSWPPCHTVPPLHP